MGVKERITKRARTRYNLVQPRALHILGKHLPPSNNPVQGQDFFYFILRITFLLSSECTLIS